MITVDQMKKARKEAEAAVGDMPEGPLKVKAFEVFLQNILDQANLKKEVTVEEKRAPKTRTTTKVKRESIRTRIQLLKEAHFFNVPKSNDAIVKELASKGFHYGTTSLTWTLQSLVQNGDLRRIKVKSDPTKDKEVWGYVNP